MSTLTVPQIVLLCIVGLLVVGAVVAVVAKLAKVVVIVVLVVAAAFLIGDIAWITL